MRKITFIIAALLVVVAVDADTMTVSQGSAGGQDWPVNTAARFAGKTTQVCVTNAAGGSAVPATPLARRKAIEIQNLGDNEVYCTIDGTTPVADGTSGRFIDKKANAPGNVWSLDAGTGIPVKCIAAVAAQVAGKCLMVSELR